MIGEGEGEASGKERDRKRQEESKTDKQHSLQENSKKIGRHFKTDSKTLDRIQRGCDARQLGQITHG